MRPVLPASSGIDAASNYKTSQPGEATRMSETGVRGQYIFSERVPELGAVPFSGMFSTVETGEIVSFVVHGNTNGNSGTRSQLHNGVKVQNDR